MKASEGTEYGEEVIFNKFSGEDVSDEIVEKKPEYWERGNHVKMRVKSISH